MKVIAITDIHSSAKNTKELISVINNIDAIIVAGDISHFGPFGMVKYILSLLASTGAPVFFVPGNCDPQKSLHWEDSLKHIFNLHGKHHKIQGFFLAGVGGSVISPFNTFIEYTEDEYLELLNKATKGLNDFSKLILIVHNPPYNTKLDMVHGNTHVGSSSVREFIEVKQPLLIITGHIHESRGIDQIGRTVMVNPGPLKWGYYALMDISNEKVDVLLEKV